MRKLKMNKKGSFFFVPAISAILLLGCSFGNNDASTNNSPTVNPPAVTPPSVTPSTAKTASEIIKSLGVSQPSANMVSMKSTLGTDVSVNPGVWHPLKSEYSIMSPSAEIFQVGIPSSADSNSMANSLADAGSFAVTTPETGDQGWAKNSYKTSVTADLDGDGIDEIAVFYVLKSDLAKAYVRVYRNGAFSAPLDVGITVSQLTADNMSSFYQAGKLASGTPWFPYLSAAAGDIDGNNSDEIFLVNDKSVYVLSIPADGTSCAIKEKKTYSTAVSSVAAGDCDGDGKAEFIVCRLPDTGTDALYALYDSSFSKALTNPEFVKVDGCFLEAAFGDFDGDRIDEMCIASTGTGAVSMNAIMYNYDGDKITVGNTISGFKNLLNGGGTTYYFRLCPRALDFDFDGIDELGITFSVYDKPMTQSSAVWNLYDVWDRKGDATIQGVSVGDVDANGTEDLVITSFAQNSTNTSVQAIGLDSSGTLKNLKAGIFSGNCVDVPWLTATVSAGNVDKDSTRVKFAGHELKFTDPIILAVLVSPPFYKSIAASDQTYAGSYPNWNTTFGMSSADGAGSGTSVGFSIGASIEYDQDLSVFGVKIGSVKASMEFANNTSWEWNTDYKISKEIVYSCTGGEDRVIFTCVPMDVYSYTILESANPKMQVGKTIEVKIPREFETIPVSRTFYNEHNGELPDIDSTVIAHTIGDPKSYPTVDQKNALLGKYPGYESKKESVGQADTSVT